MGELDVVLVVYERLYLHSDEAPIYKCYDTGELIVRIACLERQIRRIAKYRNNSFFVGSPAAGVRFARLMSVFANIRNHKLDPVKYLCDVFRRIKNTANDRLVELLAHKWQPATVSAWV